MYIHGAVQKPYQYTCIKFVGWIRGIFTEFIYIVPF